MERTPTPPAPIAQPAPTIGVTGGEVPQFESDRPAQTPRYSPDPAIRQQQVSDEINRRRAAKNAAANPFTPTAWTQDHREPGSIRADREFATGAEKEFQYQQAQGRAAITAGHAADTEARKTANDTLEAKYRGNGQQFYTDAHGKIQAVKEAGTNRELYHATTWAPDINPKTGAPALAMRDKYGQRQFKEAPIVPGLDPTDDQMYYKMPDGTTAPAGSIDQMAQHPNYNIAKQALAAKTRNVKAIHQQALEPLKAIADQFSSQLEDARGQVQAMDAQIAQTTELANNTAGTPLGDGYSASLSQMQAKRDALDAQTKPKGQLGRQVARARAGYAIASAQAMHDTYAAQQEEIAARVRAAGGKPENDPTYQSNLRSFQQTQQLLQGAHSQFDQVDANLSPTSATAGTGVPEGATPGTQPTQGPIASDPLQQSEPVVALKNGVKNVGGVSMQEFAKRYGSGQGKVQPGSLVKLDQRRKEIDETLSNADSTVNQTLRDQMQKERDYIDNLYKQRFARLPDADQKVVNKIISDKESGATGAFARAAGVNLAPAAAAAGGFAMGAKIGQPLAGQTRGIAPLVTGTLGAFVASSLASKAQKAALEKASPEALKELEHFSQLDQEQHPLASASGEALANLSIFKASPLLAARGLAAVIKIARGAAVTKTEQTAAKVLAQQAGFAGATAVGTPLLSGEKPTAEGVTKDMAQMLLLGESRFGGHGKSGEPGKAGGEKPKGPQTPEQIAADTEFQKKLNEEAAPEPKPSTAEEAAHVFEPALKEKANTPPPAKSASESAETLTKVPTDTELSKAEGENQKLVDQIQESSGKPRDEILATRKDKTPEQWGEELKKEAEYRKSPLTVDPERRATELKADLAKLDTEWGAHVDQVAKDAEAHAQQQDITDRAQNVPVRDSIKASFDEARVRHNDLTERRTAIETELKKADDLRKSPASAEDLKGELTDESTKAATDARKLATPELEARRDAIESGLSEQDRVKQSNKGAADLKTDLIQEQAAKTGPETAKLSKDEPGKLKEIQEAIKNPDLKYQYSVWDRAMIPKGERVAQIDLIDPSRPEADQNVGSTNLALLREQGVDMPAAPESLPPGRYTREQIQEAIAKEKPSTEKSNATSPRQEQKNSESQHPGAVSRPAVSENVGEIRQGEGTQASSGNRPVGGEKVANSEATRPILEKSDQLTHEEGAAPISAHIEEHTPETLAGEKINKNWTAFDKEAGSLDIPRSEMPQIKSEHRGALVNFLKARGIPAKGVMVRPGDLKPTQAEFSPQKVQAAREHTGANRPILISADGHVIDGHHQWMSELDDPTTPMPAIKLDAPVDKVLSEVKEFPSQENVAGAAPKAAEAAQPATKRLSDRAIEALQKAKIDTKGKLFDVTQGAYVAAHNAAIDLAILGVRAGRSVADVVKLVVDRFKAKHPEHSQEQLDSLTDDVRAAITPKETDTPAAVLDSKEATSSRSKVAEAWKNYSEKGDLKETLTVARDAADNAAETMAGETHTSIKNELNRNVPKEQRKLAADALAFHVEAGDGGVKRLDEMARQLMESTKADPKWKQQALDAIAYAKNNYDALKSTADLYRGFTDRQAEQEQTVGLPTLKRKDYVPHQQDVEESSWLNPAGGMSPTGASNRKNRVHDTFADSIAAGVDPKSLNAIDLLRNRVKNGQTGVGLRQWQDSLKTFKDPKTGETIATKPERVERADGSVYYQPPEGYENEMLGGSPIAVKKEYAGIIGALTDPSWWSKTEGRRLAQKVNATGKQVNLMMDTYHLGRLAIRQASQKLGSVADMRAPLPSYKEGLGVLERSPEEIKKMADNGEIPKEDVTDLLRKKQNLNLLTSQGLNVGHVADAMHQDLVSKIPIVGEHLHGLNRFIFEKYTRGAMTEAALMDFDRQTKSNPDLTPQQVARQTAKNMNVLFGNLGRQGIFKSKTAQDIMRMIMLAPQWNESLLRAEGGGAIQAGKAAIDAVTGKKLAMGALGRGMAANTIGLFAANQILNYATRGKPTWENPEEGWGSKLSAWIPDKIGGKGSGFFLNPLGVSAEISHMFLNSMERHGSIPEFIRDYAKSRASAVARPAVTLATGKDAIGGNIRSENLGREIAKSAVPAPIGGSAIAAAARGIRNGGNTEQFPGQYQKQLLSTFGLKTDSAPSPEQRMQSLAKDFKQNKGVQASAEFYAGDYSDLTNALRRNNPKDISDEIKNLKEKKSDAEIRRHYHSWGATPFTGQKDRESEFIRTLNSEQRQVYVKAQQERKTIGSRALQHLAHPISGNN